MIPEDMYLNLREWHLARLRNLAQEGAVRAAMTPAGLIASDKEAVKQLVQANTNSAKTLRKNFKFFRLNYPFCFWICVQIVSLLMQVHSAQNLFAGLSKYLAVTIAALVNERGFDTALFENRFCFAGFYVLPSLMLAFLPADSFRSLVVKQERVKPDLVNSRQYASAMGFLILFACIGIIGLNGKQAITLGAAWLSTGLFFVLFAAKYESCRHEIFNLQLSKIEKDLFLPGNSGIVHRLEKLDLSVKEQLQRENAIADFSKVVIVSFDEMFKIDAVSPSVFMQWGYNQYELLNRQLGNFVFREDLSILEEIRRRAKEGAPLELVLRIRKRDNSIGDYLFYVDWSAKFERFFAACEDVTDRRNLERARDDFIAQLTHDMRSPLAAVTMTLALFTEKVFGEMPEKAHEPIERARKGVARVLALISDILDAEKLNQNKQAIEKVQLNLLELVRKVADELGPLAHEKEVSILVDGTDSLVWADYNLLTRVLTNLLSNALSFSPPQGTVTMHISATDNSALVSVKDIGPGIHQDYHRLIFERYKAPKMLETKRVSTGLGLWICKEIISAHGGSIGVDSELGKGSKFWFTIPLSSN